MFKVETEYVKHCTITAYFEQNTILWQHLPFYVSTINTKQDVDFVATSFLQFFFNSLNVFYKCLRGK